MTAAHLTWSDLFVKGSLIDLDIGVWRPFVRMRAEDIGVSDADEVRQALTFGSERLVHKDRIKKINKLANDARATLEANSVVFPLVYGSRFVPTDNWKRLEEKLTNIAAKFKAEVDSFVAEYDESLEEMRPVLHEALVNAAHGNATDAEHALERIESRTPSAAEVKDKFYLTWRSFSIEVPRDEAHAEASEEVASDVRKALADMVLAMREEFQDRMKGVLELVSRGGKLTKRTHNSVKKTLAKLKSINFIDDAATAAAIRRMELALDGAASDGENHKGLVESVKAVKTELKVSVDDAVKRAEEKLTGLGRRRF